MKSRRAFPFVSMAAATLLMASGGSSVTNAPLPVSPGSASGTEIAAACPTFSWGAVEGANSYQIIAYRVPAGASATAGPQGLEQLWTVTLPGTVHTWTPPVGQCFAHGGRFAWAVRATIGATAAAWSTANLFSVEKAPSAQDVRDAIATLHRYLVSQRAGQTEGAKKSASADGTRSGEAYSATRRKVGGRRARNRVRAPAPTSVHRRRRALTPKGSLPTYASTPSLGTPSLSVDGNISLGASDNLFKGGNAYMWDDTVGNFALGKSALASVRGYASENTAVGTGALEKDYGHTGVDIPYTGPPDLYLDSSYNSAFGYEALQSNHFGHDNSAFGAEALLNNDNGIRNTGIGAAALRANSAGEDNTAVGAYALIDNNGGANTAVGAYALQRNSYASGNTAVGWAALRNNTVDNGGYVGGRYAGDFNTALGSKALIHNGSGAYNTAVGRNALSNVTTGSNNIGVGAGAGSALTSGDHDDIMIGHPGYAGDSGVIAIGKSGNQSKIYVAAIDGVTTDQNNAVGVVVAGNNQLGTVSSSRRFKEDIKSMGSATDRLYDLRPVTFRYKKYVKEAIKEGKDPSKLPIEYGLIAEEVAKVYPNLVVYDKKGRPETIKYRYLAPMLLNELEKEHRELLAERAEIMDLKHELRSLDR